MDHFYDSDAGDNQTCTACADACTTWVGTLDSEWVTCDDSNTEAIIGSGSCICSPNFYNSATLPLVTWTACANVCTTCDGGSYLQCITWVDANATADTTTATSNECIWNAGYFNAAILATDVTCDPCHATWGTCTADGDTDCITCADPNARITSPSGTCLCNVGFYDADSTDAMNCTACDATCATCSVGATASDCDSCVDSNASTASSPGACTCNSGYNDIDAGAGITCSGCHLSWATCSDTTINGCDTCLDPQASIATAPGPCLCNDGYYDSNPGDSMVWDRCHGNWATCAWSGYS